MPTFRCVFLREFSNSDSGNFSNSDTPARMFKLRTCMNNITSAHVLVTMAADQLEKTRKLLTPARSLHPDAWLIFSGTEFLSGVSGGGLEVESRKLSTA